MVQNKIALFVKITCMYCLMVSHHKNDPPSSSPSPLAEMAMGMGVSYDKSSQVSFKLSDGFITISLHFSLVLKDAKLFI